MNRRQLLQLLLATLGSTTTGNLFAKQGSRIRLVLVELAGANDGLNTLVPISDENYRRLRPNIGLGVEDVISLTDDFAVHNALKPLMSVWEQGQLAWVQGLGYPSPNRSHFKSIALWETGSDGNKQRRNGWITHDIEHNLGRTVTDAHGISMAEDMNIFASDNGRWLSMTSTAQFQQSQLPTTTKATVLNNSMAAVNKRVSELEQTLFGLSSKLGNKAKVKSIPGGELGSQLRQVVSMIRAGIDAPVYRVKLGGFDTHENQLYRHKSLLTELAKALRGFQKTLSTDGEWNNTLVMTYSEFGRRAAENRSAGTDHGTAAPHMLLGGAINGGLFGSQPLLDGLETNADPEHTMDYRALYNAVLAQGFGIRSNGFKNYTDQQLAGLIKQ